LACAAACSSAADAPALVSRIREHMREYIAHLPDYTCRITLERFKRPKARAPFDLSDRLRLEVAYTGGQELYSWPGDDRFEAGIEDLLPGHGMVSNGTYALHVRNLFVRDVAEFSAPHDEKCEARPCVRLDFLIPAVRSGYSLSAGNGSAPAPLVGSAWFDASNLDIARLEVRVDDAPRSVRIAATRETTVYQRARIGDVEFVVPGTSELLLRDRDGSELVNRSRFDRYHRYAGTATVSYAPPGDTPAAPVPPPKAPPKLGKQLVAALNTEIGEDAAIGDPFTATTADGMQVAGRITSMRRVGKGWIVDLTVSGLSRRGVPLPVKAGTRFTWKAA
jgi:hypothetical protein